MGADVDVAGGTAVAGVVGVGSSPPHAIANTRMEIIATRSMETLELNVWNKLNPPNVR